MKYFSLLRRQASTGITALLASATGHVLGAATTDFARLYTEQGLALPALTRMVLSVPPQAYGVGWLLVAVAVIAKESLIADPATRAKINLLVALAGMLTLILVLEGLRLPFSLIAGRN